MLAPTHMEIVPFEANSLLPDMLQLKKCIQLTTKKLLLKVNWNWPKINQLDVDKKKG